MKITIPKNANLAKQTTNYYFLIDLSGSMYYSANDLKDTLREIKNILSPGDTYSLAYFSSHNDFDWICKGATNTSNLEKLINEKVYARGLTNFTDVLGSLENTIKDVELVTGVNSHALYGWISK